MHHTLQSNPSLVSLQRPSQTRRSPGRKSGTGRGWTTLQVWQTLCFILNYDKANEHTVKVNKSFWSNLRSSPCSEEIIMCSFYSQCSTQESTTCSNQTVRMKRSYSLKNRSLRNRLPARSINIHYTVLFFWEFYIDILVIMHAVLQLCCREWTNTAAGSLRRSHVSTISDCNSTFHMLIELLLFSSQLAYQAWVTSVKAALRDRQRRQRHLRRIESKNKEREGKAESQQGPLSMIGEIFLLTIYCQKRQSRWAVGIYIV